MVLLNLHLRIRRCSAAVETDGDNESGMSIAYIHREASYMTIHTERREMPVIAAVIRPGLGVHQ